MSDTLDSLRAERDEAHARSVAAGNERDALRQQLRDQAAEAEELVEQGRQAERDAIANREPTADEIDRLEDEWEHAVGPVARWWWQRIRDALRAPANDDRVFVIFDGPPSQPGRFVELEDARGHGVAAGSWAQRPDGLWSLGPFLTATAPTSDDLPVAPSCIRCMDLGVVQDGMPGSVDSCPACAPAPAPNRCPSCRVVLGPSPGWHECRGATWAASILHRAESELATIANNTGRLIYPDEADALIAELARLRAEKEQP